MALIYKELLKVERQKHKNHAEKRANDKKNSSPQKGLKKWPLEKQKGIQLLHIRGVQTEASRGAISHPSSWQERRSLTTRPAGEAAGKQAGSDTVGDNADWCPLCGWTRSHRSTCALLFDPAIPLLGVHPEDRPLATQNTEAGGIRCSSIRHCKPVTATGARRGQGTERHTLIAGRGEDTSESGLLQALWSGF